LVQEVLAGKEGTEALLARYDAFAMRSFVEDNRALVWCTGGWADTGATQSVCRMVEIPTRVRSFMH
jgi:hypothetical protein